MAQGTSLKARVEGRGLSRYLFGLNRVSQNQRGFGVLEALLSLTVLILMVACVVPAFLASHSEALREECGIRLAVIQRAKRQVMEEMNLILPARERLKMTDRLSPLHIARVRKITRESPWRFAPEDPCPQGAVVHMGVTFLEPPTCEDGTAMANLDFESETTVREDEEPVE